MEASNFITVVSGLPRSGTSLMMQMLVAGGISPLTDNVRSPDENNPRGYFEFDPVKRLRTDASWLDQATGCVVKIVHILLRELPRDPTNSYRVIFMRRNIAEVVASQRVMLEREGKKAVDDATLTGIYRSQLEQLEHWLGAQPNFAVLHVEHRALLDQAERIVREVNEFLGGNLNAAAMRSAIDPALYRQRIV